MSNISKNVKIVVYVPESHSDVVREAMGKAGAGIAIKSAHPYEEIALDIYSLEN